MNKWVMAQISIHDYDEFFFKTFIFVRIGNSNLSPSILRKERSYIFEVFIPLLRERGVSLSDIDIMMCANPARAFSFE